MADYRVVDIEKLETDLTEMADEVRVLVGTTEKMSMNKMTESVAQANESVEVQTDIISQIKTVLRGKVAGEKEEQEKTLSVTANGSYSVEPDEGKALSKVDVDVNVALDDIGKPYLDTSKITDFKYFGSYDRFSDSIDLIALIDTSNGIDFTNMFSSSTELLTIPELDTSKGTIFTAMFNGCSKLTSVGGLDTSNGTTFTSMFAGCSSLTDMPDLDISNGLYFVNMFMGCASLKELPLLDISKGNQFHNMFMNCTSLTKISLTKASVDLPTTMFQNCTALKDITIEEGWDTSIYLNYSDNLWTMSIIRMIENLADLTGKTAKTFKIGSTNLSKLNETHLAMLQNKNWNYS